MLSTPKVSLLLPLIFSWSTLLSQTYTGTGGIITDDGLINDFTIDVQDLVTDENTGKKRLTVAVDRPKLEKLKAIAKLENAFLIVIH